MLQNFWFNSCKQNGVGFSVIGLIFCLIGGPIWHFFSVGFSFNGWVLFEYFMTIAALVLVLLGNRRQKPYYYLPVLALMFISLVYTSSIVYRSYLEVTKDVMMFKETIHSSPKLIVNHETAKIAVEYFQLSLSVHLAVVSVPLILYAMNILLTDYFFLIAMTAKPMLPWL